MDLNTYNKIKETHQSHWAGYLQVADRVTGTIRHKTDGSKNIHNAELIVIKNIQAEGRLVAWYNNKKYKVPYMDLKPLENQLTGR